MTKLTRDVPSRVNQEPTHTRVLPRNDTARFASEAASRGKLVLGRRAAEETPDHVRISLRVRDRRRVPGVGEGVDLGLGIQ